MFFDVQLIQVLEKNVIMKIHKEVKNSRISKNGLT